MGDWTMVDNRGAAGRERRDPRGATAGITYNGLGQAQVANWDATTAVNQGYLASWLVYRAVNILADTVSRLPFRAGLDLEKPQEFSQNAPLARLLGPPPEGPNPEMSARKLWKMAVLNYLITGRFAWEIEYGNGNDVAGLWHLPMGGFSAVPSFNKRAYFDGFKLEQSGLPPIPFTREQIVYGYNPSPNDVRQPESVIQALRLNVSLMISLDQYQYAFIRNDAKPSTVVIHGPMASRDAKVAFERKFGEDYRGPQNANKTAFVEVDPDDEGTVAGMLDIKTIGASAKDSQLSDVYQQQLSVVCSGIGVPQSLMDASNRTFDNAGQEAQNFYEITVLPLLADMQDHINRDLAPKVGNEVGWFDISDVPALKPSFPSFGVTMTDLAADTLRNERRSFIGLGPVDEKALAAEKEADAPPALAPFAGTDPAAKPATAIGAGPDPAPAITNGASDDTAARSEQRRVAVHTVWQCSPGCCDMCKELDGLVDSTKQPVIDTHPNCECTNDIDMDYGRSDTRHAGPDGHSHVPSGHTLLDQAVTKARNSGVERTKRLLGRQLTRWDARSETAAVSRAQGKRGQQAKSKQERLDAVYDRNFWEAEARAVLAPVYEAAVAAASASLEGFFPIEADLTEWCDARADALATVLVARRVAALNEVLADEMSTDEFVAAVRSVHQDRVDLADLAAPVFDDAVRATAGVDRSMVRDLLTKLVSGEVDLDAAMKELVTDA